MLDSLVLEYGKGRRPETSVTNYQPTPPNKLQQRRPEFKGLAQRINCERDKTSSSVAHRNQVAE